MFRYETAGHCPICEQETTFVAQSETEIERPWWKHWFRGELKCQHCNSIPRERALFEVLTLVRPDWRSAVVHESSPEKRGASLRLQNECVEYVETQYDTALPRGAMHPTRGYRCEDLERQTFADACFDIVVTQDVFEHLFAPDRAIIEIARTLKPDGIYIMTVPIVLKDKPSIRRAAMRSGTVQYLLPAQYHSNPIDQSGTLVTIDWGYDIAHYLSARSGLVTAIYSIDDISKGIRAEYNEVVVCRKSSSVLTL